MPPKKRKSRKADKQSELFDTGRDGDAYPVSPYVDITAKKSKGNPQSKKANRVAAPFKNFKRVQIYVWFRDHGPAIAEDAVKAFPQWSYPTVTARISELRRDGFLICVGEKNTQYSNSPADLLKVSDLVYPGLTEFEAKGRNNGDR
jgi:hypothetical protein